MRANPLAAAIAAASLALAARPDDVVITGRSPRSKIGDDAVTPSASRTAGAGAGAKRARLRLMQKFVANREFYADTPVDPPSRQVRRRAALKAAKRRAGRAWRDFRNEA